MRKQSRKLATFEHAIQCNADELLISCRKSFTILELLSESECSRRKPGPTCMRCRAEHQCEPPRFAAEQQQPEISWGLYLLGPRNGRRGAYRLWCVARPRAARNLSSIVFSPSDSAVLSCTSWASSCISPFLPLKSPRMGKIMRAQGFPRDSLNG